MPVLGSFIEIHPSSWPEVSSQRGTLASGVATRMRWVRLQVSHSWGRHSLSGWSSRCRTDIYTILRKCFFKLFPGHLTRLQPRPTPASRAWAQPYECRFIPLGAGPDRHRRHGDASILEERITVHLVRETPVHAITEQRWKHERYRPVAQVGKIQQSRWGRLSEEMMLEQSQRGMPKNLPT